MADNITPENMTALMPVYARQDVYFERGEGCWIYDDRGNKYLDFVAGIAVCAFGHAHPRIVGALHAQAQKLWIMSNYYKCHSAENLAKKLTEISFADTVFFQNSGAEAWELGVKVIRKYFSAIGKPERYRVISMQGCFHGRTLAAIAASKAEKMVKGFGPMTDGFDQVAWGNLNELRAAITPQTAAIMVEPVLGEGGIKVATKEYLQEVRNVCDEFGLLLYYDEIQCGLGRTGKLWAHEWSGVTPDVMCIAKALGNGFPVSACLATAAAAQGMYAGTHGSTYGGNPMGAAIATEVLTMLLESGFLDGVHARGQYLAGKLEGLIKTYPKLFKERRGTGLMQGLVCHVPNGELVDKLRAEKMLVAMAGDNVVRMLPPLIVGEAEIDHGIMLFEKIAKTYN